MPSDKFAHKLDIRLGPSGAGDASTRRATNRLVKLDKESARAKGAISRQLKTFTVEYRKQLTKLIGPRGMRELSAIRNSRAKLRRSQKIRRSLALLNQYGVDRAQILELRQPYLLKTRDLLSQAAEIFPYLNPFDGPCESPWVTHSAPFTGYSWAFNWHRTSNPRNPVLERYLDTSTGRIGSSIETKVSGAGDDDELVAEYYAGLNVWHTPQMTGPLEVYLTFEFTTSNYSGKVTDEFGFSDVTHNQ